MEIKLRRPSQPRAKSAQKTDPDDPLNFSMPTLEELEAQIRRRPIGRTIAERVSAMALCSLAKRVESV